jgi:putative ABC transport system permease protein
MTGKDSRIRARYRLLLHLYPRAFRARFGADMEDVFADRMRPLVQTGRRTTIAAAWVTTLGDVVWHATAERLRAAGHWIGSPRAPRLAIGRDVRYAVRLLARRPGFTAVAVLTLALGTGANGAVYTIVHAVVFQPLPYSHADRLVTIWEREKDGSRSNTSYATSADWRAASRTVDVAAWRSWQPTITSAEGPERLNGLRVSANYFRMLGVAPVVGRDFTDADDTPSTRRVVLLTHGLWERRFSSRPDVVGKPLVLDGFEYRIAGVLPKGFKPFVPEPPGPDPEIWAPIGYDLTQAWSCRTCRHLFAGGRVREPYSVAEAAAELDAIQTRLWRDHPQDYPAGGATIIPLQDAVVSEVKPAFMLLLGAVGFVLLIACANVSHLLLMRSVERRNEIAIRAAIGADRATLARQLLIETCVIACAGAAAGLLLASGAVPLLVAIAPASIPRLDEIHLDVHVVVVTLAASTLCALAFGTIPALRATSFNVHASLKPGDRAVAGGRHHRMRATLVTANVAIAVVLLAGAALLGRSFVNLITKNPGFDAQGVLTMDLMATGPRYQANDATITFYRQVLERVEAMPGVQSAGIVSQLPFGHNSDQYGVHADGYRAANAIDDPSAYRYSISPDYFKTLGVPLRRGRAFDTRDGEHGALVAIVNETLARRVFGNDDPIGKGIRIGTTTNPARAIVGVVADTHQHELGAPPILQIYVPATQFVDSAMTLVMRVPQKTTGFADEVRKVIWSIDRDQPVYNVAMLDDLVAASVGARRFTITVLSVFAVSALAMAAIGLYGLVSFSVSARTREIGVRAALGAQRGDILRLVLSEGLTLVAGGAAIGVGLSAALARFIDAFLFGVTPADPLTFVAVATLLTMVSAAAAYVPARRATAVDPAIALRTE